MRKYTKDEQGNNVEHKPGKVAKLALEPSSLFVSVVFALSGRPILLPYLRSSLIKQEGDITTVKPFHSKRTILYDMNIDDFYSITKSYPSSLT